MELKKRQAQDRVIGLIAQGMNVTQAMKAVGREAQTFHYWTKNEPWFKDRVNAVRHREEGEKLPDFVAFRKAFFGFETFYHQQRIVDVIEEAPEGSITMVLLPPGGGKTSVLEDYMCFKLGEDPNWRFALISETRDLGRKVLRNVSNRMTDRSQFAAYIDRYGPFRPSDRSTNQPWNADILTHVQAKSGERDYSLEVKGAGSTIYGASFDDIILDDIQSSKSLNKTEVLLTYFRQTLYSRMMRANTKGRIFIIGTRQGPGDFYEELLNQDIDIRLVKIEALDEHGNSYFPRRTMANGEDIGFSEADFIKIRSVVGEEAWSRQYMQEPVSKRGRTFTEAMLKNAQDEKRTISTRNPPGMFRMGSLDPALGGHTVWRIGSMDFDHLYLLDGANEEGLSRYEEIYEKIDLLSTKWKPNVWIIEGNAIQKGILRDDRVLALSKKHGFRIEAHQTGHNKTDPLIGIPAMAGPFLRGEISIPWGDDESRACFAPMLADLRRWRPDVPSRLLQQDEVMALWFQYLYWQRTKSELALEIPTQIRRPGLPWAKTRYPVSAAR
mgnify:CR=1 FL=1